MDPPVTSTSNPTSTPAPSSAAASPLTEPSPPPPPPLQSQSQSQPQPQPQQTLQPTPQTPSTTPPTPNNPTTNPNPSPSLSLTKPPAAAAASTTAATTRPQIVHRPWQHPHPHSHFTSSPSGPSISSSSTVSPPIPSPRGLAIGVPAPSPGSFSSTFGHHISGLNRPPVSVPESLGSTSNPQVRPGMISNSQMRPHQQPRPSQLSIRPPPSSPSNPSPTTQSFQGHAFIRSSPISTAVSPLASASQGMQTSNQPWLLSSSASQGKPPLPSPSYRPQMNSPSMQQRSHIQQPHHSLPITSQQQHVSSAQPQQPLTSHQQPEHFGQQFPPSRVQHSSTHPQPAMRVQGTLSHKPSSLAMSQPNTVQPVMQSKIANTENDDGGNRILSKRSIHELVSQIDPSEKLDPQVEDILADIADEFVVSATTFGCSLAKHRKSDTLEAKDILLHLDRNWNMTLPGFSGDEIKSYRKQVTNDIHKERLTAIKKSVLASDMANAKNSVGQAVTNAKSNMSKTLTNVIVSPNLKVT